MPVLEARALSLRYGATLALDRVSFSLEDGETFAVLGPSGCGKTSLLRVIAGLERPQAGEVWLDGRCIDGMPPHRRGFGLMFQEFALFPHLRVAQNVEFGLRMQGLPRADRRRRVKELLALVGLEGYETRRMHELSGGERQRVALARSLAPNPRLLMLDEPIGALDRNLRESLLLELRTLLTQLGQTALYVTHDQEEAFAIADRVLVMEGGRVRQIGRPAEVYQRPANAFVARFIGLPNLLPGRVEAGRDGRRLVRTAVGTFCAPADSVTGAPLDAPPGTDLTLLLGNEGVQLQRRDTGGDANNDANSGAAGLNRFRARVAQRSFRGRTSTFRLDASGRALQFEVENSADHAAIAPGDEVSVTLAAAAVRVLAEPADSLA